MAAAPFLDDKGWYCLERDVDARAIETLRGVGHVEKLSLTEVPLVTVRHVAGLESIPSVEQIWLWCDVTRRAMRHVVQIPGLVSLDVLRIRGPGELAHFDKARTLKAFRANQHMMERDLLQVARCESIEELGAQYCELTHDALSALLCLPRLRVLDLEATRFDDAMARRVSRSDTITSLDVGATRITREGLSHLVSMKALRSLDLWANRVNEDDLRLLLDLPNLECLSIGDHEGSPSLDAQRVVPLLMEMPSLKRVWLDGVRIGPEHKVALESKLESLRVTSS